MLHFALYYRSLCVKLTMHRCKADCGEAQALPHSHIDVVTCLHRLGQAHGAHCIGCHKHVKVNQLLLNRARAHLVRRCSLRAASIVSGCIYRNYFKRQVWFRAHLLRRCFPRTAIVSQLLHPRPVLIVVAQLQRARTNEAVGPQGGTQLQIQVL